MGLVLELVSVCLSDKLNRLSCERIRWVHVNDFPNSGDF